MRTLLVAFILSAAVPSYASECNSYVARDYPTITINETEDNFTVAWDRYSETYTKTVKKIFGVLAEGAIDMENQGEGDYSIVREKIDGKDAMIFDSITFLPSCE